ncbi:MAG: hypothetical protein ACE14L_16700 [Terriglobales bacterium]
MASFHTHAEKSWLSIYAKGISTLFLTVLLCLPSLVGGTALLLNLLRYRNIGDWEQVSSALIASGIFFGGPLVALAALVGGAIAFSRGVSLQVKYAHLVIVILATIATLALLLRFGN